MQIFLPQAFSWHNSKKAFYEFYTIYWKLTDMLHQFIMYIQCLNTENIPVRSTIFAAVVKICPIDYTTVVNSVADPGDARSHLSLNSFIFIQFFGKNIAI